MSQIKATAPRSQPPGWERTRRQALLGNTWLPRQRYIQSGTTSISPGHPAKFSAAFRKTLRAAGVQPVLLPPRSPNLNAHQERFFRSLKSECLDQLIFFGERSLRRAVREYLVHYHGERNHQGLGNRLIQPAAEAGQSTGAIGCRQRLGGLLRYYHRRAA